MTRLKRTKLVGILNVTPDSFSDGGEFSMADAARMRVEAMIGEGAAVVDIGAESTRPGAEAISVGEEWQRLFPVLAAALPLCHAAGVKVSLDTRHAETAEKGLSEGVDWINDVSGFEAPAMCAALSKWPEAYAVAMHSMSVPADSSKTLPEGSDVIMELKHWAVTRFTEMEQQGIARERILFDPGIGFGKTAQQSLEILRRIKELQTLGVPLLVGHSRKSFLSQFTARPANERDLETSLFSFYLAGCGVEYLRVHNLAANAAALKIAEAIRVRE